MKKIFKSSILSAAIIGASMASAADKSFVTIGTGGQTGVYYAVGQSVCKLVNRDTKKTGIKCNAPSTGGSVANVNAIEKGDQDMGIAQSDVQYKAYNGLENFKGKADKDLRSVFSIHTEAFTMVARKDSGIKKFTDIKGKRVNIGNPGSGTRSSMENTMAAEGLSIKDLAVASELKPAEMASTLCDNNLDAITYTVGNPSGSIKEATTSCDSIIVPVEGPAIDKIVADHPYYATTVIPAGMYTGTDTDTKTYGVLATLVTSSKVSDDKVYEVVKAVFDNFDRFKKLHPAFANLKKEDMIKNGNSAPLHPGAIRYYKEKGLM